jgi:hypothetical protein
VSGGVIHAFECAAHGVFEKRVKYGEVPKCPRGCSKSFVQLIFVQAPGQVSSRTRKADKLLREAATLQRLSDISTSPSRPGGSVAERNAMKNRRRIKLPDGSYGYVRPEQAAIVPDKGLVPKYLGALTNRESMLQKLGFGNPYDPAEWVKDKESGKLRHEGLHTAEDFKGIPTGSTGVEIERVKEKSQ